MFRKYTLLNEFSLELIKGKVCSYLVFPHGLLKDQEVRILLLYY